MLKPILKTNKQKKKHTAYIDKTSAARAVKSFSGKKKMIIYPERFAY